MNAILFHQHGNTDVLEYGDFPPPEPGPGQVLVRLKAAALNHLDIWVRNGWPGLKLQYPHIPGADGAGEVAALGEGISRWSVGERVVINPNLSCGTCEYCLIGMDNRCIYWGLLGETTRGTYAEYIAVSARNLLRIPDGFGEHEAAAAALVFLTAWHSLIRRGQLKAGETVLIVGASGGVNLASLQIAKLSGAQVFVVGSHPEKLVPAGTLGADYLIDRSEDKNWSETVYRITEKRGVDIVVDNVGTTFAESFRAAGRGGRVLTVGNTGHPRVEIDNRFIFAKHLSLIGSTMGTHNDFRTVMELVFNGRLVSIIDQTFPLSEAGAAQTRLERGDQIGKITLEIG
ncbi:MAG TPA: alcohol dehydrogenase catalytic domain-containing protein [Anaerolineales bacterium]|nr:alcohol dehydrogenase catalytic domain-containing protein [Anaerolineales bacterium]